MNHKNSALILLIMIGLAACKNTVTSLPNPSPSGERPTPELITPSPTPTLSPTVPPPTATCTPSPTPESTATEQVTPTPCEHELYLQSCYGLFCDYAGWDPGSQASVAFVSDISISASWRIANSFVAFANTGRKVASWTYVRQAQLWLADLDAQQPELIYTDEDGEYLPGTVQLVWTPDDAHVILESQDNLRPSMIYHLQTKQLEEWPWQCDRVAASPRSNQLALWCRQVIGPDFAVIEWGGDIWISEQAPRATLTQRHDRRPSVWAWSPDGTQIAYMEQIGADGRIVIADASGPRLNLSQEPEPPQFFHWGLVANHWSAEGDRLLINAFGTSDHPCPLYKNPLGIIEAPDEPPGQAPCWQVVDVTTGQTIWSVGDTAETIAPLLSHIHAKYSDLTLWLSRIAAISPDGNKIALSLESEGLAYLVVVDIDSGDVFGLQAKPVAIRWCE